MAETEPRLHHLAIAIEDLEDARALYRDAFGLAFSAGQDVESERVRVSFCPVGEVALELVQATDDRSPHVPMLPHPIAAFLDRQGPGVHHLCFTVPDLDGVVARLRDTGWRTVTDKPGPGADGARVIFAHPVGTPGLLIELREDDR